VSAYQDGDRVIVLIPDQFSRAEEREWVDRMLTRIAARGQRRKRSDAELLDRALNLARRHLPELENTPISVRWVSNQNSRWGSCTPSERSIRLSDRLRGMPEWVIDYVLVHELTHLVVAGHGAAFWALVARYPKAERARGYLEGITATSGLHMAGE
jgi:predicted metal-dependent hydrolase